METKENISTGQEVDGDRAVAMEEAPPQRRTIWTTRQRIVRLLWGTIGRAIWIVSPRARPSILRIFGARIGRGCTFARRVEVTIPWNLIIGDECHIAEHVILYSLGTITLGNRVRIDTRAHLCAGTHDMRDSTFPLLRPPISIGDDCFIGVDAYIAPNISLGKNTIVHPRASVYRNFADGTSLQGNPARAIQ